MSTCVCGAPNPHDPPLLGCLLEAKPIHLFDLPGWITKAELLALAMAEGKFDNTLTPEVRDKAIELLRRSVDEMMDLLVMTLGGPT